MKKLESEIRKAYQELPSTEKHTRIKGTHEGFAYEAIKNSRKVLLFTVLIRLARCGAMILVALEQLVWNIKT